MSYVPSIPQNAKAKVASPTTFTAAMLGMELRDLVTDVIMGMREVADRIGL